MHMWVGWNQSRKPPENPSQATARSGLHLKHKMSGGGGQEQAHAEEAGEAPGRGKGGMTDGLLVRVGGEAGGNHEMKRFLKWAA